MSELYVESAYYRLLFRERHADVQHYRELARRHGGPVLELGVGDGRVAFALADDGHQVTGVDRSPHMLASLEASRDGRSVEAHEADMREVRLDATFRLVLCPFNGFAHMHTHEDRAAFFDTVRAHLAPDGLFAFDLTIPDPSHLAGGTSFVPRVVHPRTGAVCRMEETYAFDGDQQVLTITTRLVERLSGEVQTLELALRQWQPAQTAQMLARAGFTVESRGAAIGDSLSYVCRLS